MKYLFDENMPITHLLKPHSDTLVLPVVPSQTAHLEAHVKLQQHQEEFLAWLETQENDDKKGGSHSYRKIR